MRTQLSSSFTPVSPLTPSHMGFTGDDPAINGTCECLVRFSPSTLPKHLRGVFLLSMEYCLLHDLGEVAPYRTKLFLRTQSGLQEVKSNMWCWDDFSTAYLTAMGPHAYEICSMLAERLERVLATTTFDQDGFVVDQ
jgi:hypothetical protein